MRATTILVILLCPSLLAIGVGAVAPPGLAVPQELRFFEVRGTSQDLFDHQIRFMMDTATPIGEGSMAPDCSDVRFILSPSPGQALTDVPLPHWIEDGCGTNATRVWIRIPELRAGSSRILAMAYGAHELPVSAGPEGTFLFFDDFDGDKLGDDWIARAVFAEASENWSADVEGGILRFQRGGGNQVILETREEFDAHLAVETRMQVAPQTLRGSTLSHYYTELHARSGGCIDAVTVSIDPFYDTQISRGGSYGFEDQCGSAESAVPIPDPPLGAWFRASLVLLPTKIGSAFDDAELAWNSGPVAQDPRQVGIYGGAPAAGFRSSAETLVDWFALRRSASEEPQVVPLG